MCDWRVGLQTQVLSTWYSGGACEEDNGTSTVTWLQGGGIAAEQEVCESQLKVLFAGEGIRSI